MLIENYSRWNTIIGWSVFAIALFTFGFTVEPTASFWDAGEYIATSAKLQVGHPPGAPFFQMMGAFFAMFAFSANKVALMVNYLSVFSSSFSVLFLFWTITMLLKKLPTFKELKSFKEKVIFFGSAVVGSLVFCFSDSFWFNAVEAEVYAMATCILSLLFWMALRWEQEMDRPRANRWLLAISFVIGLTFGVHFMGLLTIPAIGMIYFFKHTKKMNWKNFLIANGLSIFILLFIFKLLLPLTMKFFAVIEIFFVNQLRFPFHSGSVVAGLLIIAFFVYALVYTQRKAMLKINTIILCVLFILLGFSSWLMIPIRSNANTVINENAPSDARLLLAYYNLEQYPDTYLFKGPMFSDMYAGQDEKNPYKDDKPKYEQDKKTGRYIIVNEWKKARLNDNSKHVGWLPRLWSSEHAENYMRFTRPLKFSIAREYQGSEELQQEVSLFRQEVNQGSATVEDYHNFYKRLGPYLDIKKPSFWSNLQFLFSYQMGYMYWRYFMWNFVGRQNDIQGKYDIVNGNWLSGIPFIDNARLGNQSEIPSDFKNNKARNTYFFLPLILGFIGIFYLFELDKKRFWVLLLFFLLTGLALKIYLNERPFEPRERDYALVGSFYVFTIWIGIGVYYIMRKIETLKNKSLLIIPVGIVIIFIPILMAFQNWDDHDRHNRYTAQSMAKSYLQSIQKDSGAIIFTIGDNDTFALWYAQDVEGYRTDVRTVNTSLLATDWYIDQMKRKTYESEPIPSQLSHKLYAYGNRDYIKYESLLDSVRWNVKDFVKWVASDHPQTKYKHLIQQSGGDISLYPKSTLNLVYYPTNKIRIKVNKANVLKSGVVQPKDSSKIVPYIDIDLPRSGITKNRIMMLDIIANNDWERPIYFTGGSYEKAEYIWMKEYLQLEGLVYKLVPIYTKKNNKNPYILGRIDTEIMYDIVMNWDWGNSDRTDIYHDPETRKNSISYRSNMARLASQLITEQKYEKAENIIDLAMEKMPLDYFGYYSLLAPFVDGYYKLKKEKKARSLYMRVSQKYKEKLKYYRSLGTIRQQILIEELVTDIERYRTLLEVILVNEDKKVLDQEIDIFLAEVKPFSHFYGNYDYYTSLTDFVEGYYLINEEQKARDLFEKINAEYMERLEILTSLSPENQNKLSSRINRQIAEMSKLISIVSTNDSATYVNEFVEGFQELVSKIEE